MKYHHWEWCKDMAIRANALRLSTPSFTVLVEGEPFNGCIAGGYADGDDAAVALWGGWRAGGYWVDATGQVTVFAPPCGDEKLPQTLPIHIHPLPR